MDMWWHFRQYNRTQLAQNYQQFGVLNSKTIDFRLLPSMNCYALAGKSAMSWEL
jgi:hypothetical protein